MIAWTQVNWNLIKGYKGWETDAKQGIEALIEFAGRLCYQSWHKPSELTNTIAKYLANIRRQRHFSVFEHGVATFLFSGVSRSFTHELIRHRHLSYSELSQRFVNLEDPDFAFHPTLRELLTDPFSEVSIALGESQESAIHAYQVIVDALEATGLKGKKAREAAREVMQSMVATEIVVTGNMRAWRHFINVRGSEHADAQIREVAVEVARQLFNLCPNLFADVKFYTVDGQECVALGTVEES